MGEFISSEIFKGIALTDKELEIAESKFEEVLVRKGDVLLKAGDSVPNQYYVCEGCMRTYYISQDGKEFTIQFAVKDWWISDYTAFFVGGKAILTIECLENARLFRISKEDMDQLYLEAPKVESFFRVKMERFFGSFQKRILSDLAMSAKEKYLAFLKTYPNIEIHIKNYHLASYLGITTESLSRIRAEVARQ